MIGFKFKNLEGIANSGQLVEAIKKLIDSINKNNYF